VSSTNLTKLYDRFASQMSFLAGIPIQSDAVGNESQGRLTRPLPREEIAQHKLFRNKDFGDLVGGIHDNFAIIREPGGGH
jgi:hypothetical protein